MQAHYMKFSVDIPKPKEYFNDLIGLNIDNNQRENQCFIITINIVLYTGA